MIDYSYLQHRVIPAVHPECTPLDSKHIPFIFSEDSKTVPALPKDFPTMNIHLGDIITNGESVYCVVGFDDNGAPILSLKLRHNTAYFTLRDLKPKFSAIQKHEGAAELSSNDTIHDLINRGKDGDSKALL